MLTLKQLAIEGLSHLQEEGQKALAVDTEAHQILRSWVQAAAQPSRSRLSPTLPSSPHLIQKGVIVPTASASEQQNLAKLAPQTVEDKLNFLREKAQHWRAARRLGTLRDTMVFATGNPHARLMLVGEAPGYDEERLVEPFVGRAGQKLNQILAAMKLSRDDVYISNVCKFRPSMGSQQGTVNRPPSDEEIAACLPLILAEIRAIRPSCIVCLGGSSAKGLLGSASSVSALRGRWLECQGAPVRVTYHPSYLLRNESMV